MPDEPEPFALTWLLAGAYRLLTNQLHDQMAADGFSDMRSAHGFAFQVLARGGASGAELAAHLGVSKQAAGQLIDELERRGWAQRTPGPDKRTKTVILTEAGWAVTRAAEQAGARIEAELISELGAARLRRLIEDLRHLGRALESPTTQAPGAQPPGHVTQRTNGPDQEPIRAVARRARGGS